MRAIVNHKRVLQHIYSEEGELSVSALRPCLASHNQGPGTCCHCHGTYFVRYEIDPNLSRAQILALFK